MASTHLDIYKDFVGSNFLSDVTLKTSCGMLIPAHKIVLSISPFFRTMFGNLSYEEATSAVVDVPFQATTFNIVLYFIYTGSGGPYAVTDAEDLLSAATYYQLYSLKETAVAKLKLQLTEANSFDMLSTAIRYDCPLLRDHCVTLIRQCNTDVLDSPEWLGLSCDVALLLVQETVIGGELNILQRAWEWVRANVAEGAQQEVALRRFLKYIDFTAMTYDEVSEVEQMGCVPIDILYDAFKRCSLGMPPTYTTRSGGITLQWDINSPDFSVLDNHVHKTSSDYSPRLLCAMNRFSKGRHYWTFSIVDLRTLHDCYVGVSGRMPSSDFLLEPCCNAVHVPEEVTVTRGSEADNNPLLSDNACVVGVQIDYHDNCVRWYNHRTGVLLHTAKAKALPSPTCPAVMLVHKSNGGVIMSDSTTYVGSAPQSKMSLCNSPKIKATPTKPRRPPTL